MGGVTRSEPWKGKAQEAMSLRHNRQKIEEKDQKGDRKAERTGWTEGWMPWVGFVAHRDNGGGELSKWRDREEAHYPQASICNWGVKLCAGTFPRKGSVAD